MGEVRMEGALQMKLCIFPKKELKTLLKVF